SSGSFGSVYEAEHAPLEQRVAIKLLRADAARSPEAVERFRREAVAISRLQHPHAGKIYHPGEAEDGLFWLAMEFVEGEPLTAHLRRRGSLPAEEAVAILSASCEVLAEAHERGVVHRDLKPENIMLQPTAGGALLPKLLDFGMAG